MIIKVRPNLFIGDETESDLRKLLERKITAIVVVADEMVAPLPKGTNLKIFKIGLLDGPNYTWVKDLACHAVKYLMQNGENVLVQGKTGLKRGVFVAARAVCELENKSIYEIFKEIQKLEKRVDLSKTYF
jgi:hypothetical protein